MAVYCAKFSEERAERAIKSSVLKLGYTHLKSEQLNVIIWNQDSNKFKF